jgi:ankyrin repeat protein
MTPEWGHSNVCTPSYWLCLPTLVTWCVLSPLLVSVSLFLPYVKSCVHIYFWWWLLFDLYIILYVHLLSLKQKLTDAHFVLFPKNVLGETPLHVAAARGHLEVVELLLSHDGDSQLRNKDQKTPIDLAMNSAIVNLLQMSHSAHQRSSLSMYNADEYADDSDWLIHSYTILWWI